MSDGEDKVDEVVLPGARWNVPTMATEYEAGILGTIPRYVRLLGHMPFSLRKPD